MVFYKKTLSTNVATGESEVIFGFRQLPWAGGFNWTGTHTMVIDYFKVEPLEIITYAANDTFTTQINTTIDLDVLANDTAETSIVSFETTSSEGNTVTGNSSLLTFTPNSEFIGQDHFTYTIEDDEGEQATATVFITVNPRPLEAVNDAISIDIGSTDIPIDVTINDSYGENGENPTHPLTLPGGKTATASNNGAPISVVDGKVNYSAPANFIGVDTFTYTITDANGFADTATVTVTIGGNTPAEAFDDSFSINIDTETELDVLANDMSLGASIVDFDALSAEGFPIVLSSSLFTYTPSNGYNGIDTFTYTIEDSEGRQSTATVTLSVEEVVVASGALSAENDAITVDIGSSDTLINVTANDNFGSNGPHESHPLTLSNGKISTASINGGPISVVNGEINYSAPANFTGVDTFTYTITDANGFADTATVTVTVGGNLPAEAFDDTFTIDIDTETELDVLANDTPGTTIIAFDSNSVQGFAVSENSSLLIYTPTNGFEGQDSFTYTIEDSEGRQSSATVTLTVKEAVEATGTITALNDAITVDIGSSDTLINVTANDNFGSNGPHESHPLTLIKWKNIYS